MARRVIFSDEARADIRAIDREAALRLLKALARFLETDAGNVKQLEDFAPQVSSPSRRLALHLSEIWRGRY